MPNKTDNEEERDNETPQPHIAANIEKIVPLVEKNGQIDKLEEKMAKARGDLGNVYQKIENDFHGNRKAVKLVRTLLGGTTDAAYDFMRTFMRLAHHFGLVPEDDLVDMAERIGQRGPEDDEDGPKVDPAFASAPKVEKPKNTAPSRPNALDRHQEALRTGGKPPAPKGPDGDTDLVEAGNSVAEDIEAQRAEDAVLFDEAEAGNVVDPAAFEAAQRRRDASRAVMH
jgi:hypothetical protein